MRRHTASSYSLRSQAPSLSTGSDPIREITCTQLIFSDLLKRCFSFFGPDNSVHPFYKPRRAVSRAISWNLVTINFLFFDFYRHIIADRSVAFKVSSWRPDDSQITLSLSYLAVLSREAAQRDSAMQGKERSDAAL